MNNSAIDSVIKVISNVNSNRKYWLIRTMSGEYYADFVHNNFIAIGYDKIDIVQVNLVTRDKYPVSTLRVVVEAMYPEENRPGYIVNQLISFIGEIQKGDIVIIPSINSWHFSIGEVVDNVIYGVHLPPNAVLQDYQPCPFVKRRKIKWLLKDSLLEKVDPKFIPLKYTRQAITQIGNEISNVVDRTIETIYIKDDIGYLTVNVRQTDPINGYNLFTTWVDLFKLAEDFGKTHGLDIKETDFDVKLNLESPGFVSIMTASIVGLVVLSGLIGIFAGIELDGKLLWQEFKIKQEGLLQALTDYKNEKVDRKLKESLLKKLDQLDINPEQLAEMLDKVNGKQKDE